MNNLYGKKGYENITADLRVKLKKMIDKYEDDDAAKIFSTPL
ncbi:hypothetical protein [Mucilaginibacter mallensis]|nr:hypothetical protein [Mucilaginibacter mallensis]